MAHVASENLLAYCAKMLWLPAFYAFHSFSISIKLTQQVFPKHLPCVRPQADDCRSQKEVGIGLSPWSQNYKQLWAAQPWCWEQNSGPLQKQHVLLALTESSLQSILPVSCKWLTRHCFSSEMQGNQGSTVVYDLFKVSSSPPKVAPRPWRGS